MALAASRAVTSCAETRTTTTRLGMARVLSAGGAARVSGRGGAGCLRASMGPECVPCTGFCLPCPPAPADTVIVNYLPPTLGEAEFHVSAGGGGGRAGRHRPPSTPPPHTTGVVCPLRRRDRSQDHPQPPRWAKSRLWICVVWLGGVRARRGGDHERLRSARCVGGCNWRTWLGFEWCCTAPRRPPRALPCCPNTFPRVGGRGCGRGARAPRPRPHHRACPAPPTGKRLKVSFSLPQSKMADSLNVFVSGLPKTFGEAELGGMAAPFGEIVNCKVLRGEWAC